MVLEECAAVQWAHQACFVHVKANGPTLMPRQPHSVMCPQPGAVLVRRRLTTPGSHVGVQVGAVGARLLCRLRAYEQAASFQVGSGC